MAVINLRPQEDLNQGPQDLGSVIDTDSRMFIFKDTDSNSITFLHKMPNTPVAVFPVLKMGQADFWVSAVDSLKVTVNRSAAVTMNLLVY